MFFPVQLPSPPQFHVLFQFFEKIKQTKNERAKSIGQKIAKQHKKQTTNHLVNFLIVTHRNEACHKGWFIYPIWKTDFSLLQQLSPEKFFLGRGGIFCP